MATTQRPRTRGGSSDVLAQAREVLSEAADGWDADEVADIERLSALGLSLEEFLALPEVWPALEYEEGRVTQKVSPKARHSALQMGLAMLFDRLGRANKVARAFPELRFAVAGAHRSYVPDVAVYRWDRVPVDAAGEITDEVLGVPDVAVEILSPGQRPSVNVRKCEWYVQNGARASLFVNPHDHTVVLFRPGEASRTLRGEERIDLSDVLPGCVISVDEVFAPLRMPQRDS